MSTAKKVDGGYRLAFERLSESLMEDAQAVDEERALIAWSSVKLA
jgi:hypothetical protein